MANEKAQEATAFASTFYFFANTQDNAKKIKRACKPTHLDSAPIQCKLGRTQLRTDRRAAANANGLAKVAVQCSADTFVVKIATFAKPCPLATTTFALMWVSSLTDHLLENNFNG